MKVYRLHIFMAAGEYGNDKMIAAAKHHANLTEQRPLLITVTEHAGWFLEYFFYEQHIAQHRPLTVGSANDSTAWNKEQEMVRTSLKHASVISLGEIRR